jgi:hypothetical protein
MSVVFSTLLMIAIVADVRGCVCDPARPETMEDRVCSLTRIASERPPSPTVFFIQDANPTKPNRWLAIPRELDHTLQEMSAAERNVYWTAAIEKARSLWKDQWGIAINGEERRSQCQLHAHIGKLLETADKSGGEFVESIEKIPVPPAGTGIWIHAEGSGYRVHVGGIVNEPVLMR